MTENKRHKINLINTIGDALDYAVAANELDKLRSRELSLAITKLQEALFWADQIILIEAD